MNRIVFSPFYFFFQARFSETSSIKIRLYKNVEPIATKSTQP